MRDCQNLLWISRLLIQIRFCSGAGKTSWSFWVFKYSQRWTFLSLSAPLLLLQLLFLFRLSVYPMLAYDGRLTPSSCVDHVDNLRGDVQISFLTQRNPTNFLSYPHILDAQLLCRVRTLPTSYLGFGLILSKYSILSSDNSKNAWLDISCYAVYSIF